MFRIDSSRLVLCLFLHATDHISSYKPKANKRKKKEQKLKRKKCRMAVAQPSENNIAHVSFIRSVYVFVSAIKNLHKFIIRSSNTPFVSFDTTKKSKQTKKKKKKRKTEILFAIRMPAHIAYLPDNDIWITTIIINIIIQYNNFGDLLQLHCFFFSTVFDGSASASATAYADEHIINGWALQFLLIHTQHQYTLAANTIINSGNNSSPSQQQQQKFYKRHSYIHTPKSERKQNATTVTVTATSSAQERRKGGKKETLTHKHTHLVIKNIKLDSRTHRFAIEK